MARSKILAPAAPWSRRPRYALFKICSFAWSLYGLCGECPRAGEVGSGSRCWCGSRSGIRGGVFIRPHVPDALCAPGVSVKIPIEKPVSGQRLSSLKDGLGGGGQMEIPDRPYRSSIGRQTEKRVAGKSKGMRLVSGPSGAL